MKVAKNTIISRFMGPRNGSEGGASFMKKFLSLMIVVAFVCSMVIVSVPVVKAVPTITGLRSASEDTGLPTYYLGETITGDTTVESTTVILYAIDDGSIDTYSVPAFPPGTTSSPFVLRTSDPTNILGEGVYAITDGVSTVNVYLKYNLTDLSITTPPEVGSTVLVAGKITNGVPAGVGNVHVYLACLIGSAWTSVADGLTDSTGNFSFYATFSNATTYALFVSDSCVPDFVDGGTNSGVAVYAKWDVAPTSLAVLNFFQPTLLYSNGTQQFAYVRVTDPTTGASVDGVSFSLTSGVGSLVTFTGLGDGVYELVVSSSFPGIMNLRAYTASSTANFTLYFQPSNSVWNPSVKMSTPFAGFRVGGRINLSIYLNVSSQYQVHGTPTVAFSGPIEGEFDVYNSTFQTMSMSTPALITGGGQISFAVDAVLWDAGKNALTTNIHEVNYSFSITPTLLGEKATITPKEIMVNDSAEIKVVVETLEGTKKNRAKVILKGTIGEFAGVPGALYTISPDGSQVVLDGARPDIYIVDGEYSFPGLRIQKLNDIIVEVQEWASGVYYTSAVGLLKVKNEVILLNSNVDHFVAGEVYPIVQVTGAVPGLTFHYSGGDGYFVPIDNSNGTYTFSVTRVPDVDFVEFQAVDSSTNIEYLLKVSVRKPILQIVSVQESDHLITNKVPEIIEFQVVNPDTFDIMYPTYVALVPQYNEFGLQVSADIDSVNSTPPVAGQKVEGTCSSSGSNNFVISSDEGTAWTYGNKHVNYEVNKPYVAILATINDADILFEDALLVSEPSITVVPDTLYVGQSNTVEITAFDAHNKAFSGSLVRVLDPFDPSSYLATSVIGANGKATLIFNTKPSYIGTYTINFYAPNGDVFYSSKVVASNIVPEPVITITSPVSGFKTTLSDIVVSFSVSGGTAPYTFSARVDDNPLWITPIPSGSYTFHNLSNGQHTLYIKVSDANNRESLAFIDVTVDTSLTLSDFSIDPISAQVAGVPFSITIKAIDQNGDLYGAFNGTVNLSDLSGSISPTVTARFVNGVWTGSVTITKAIEDNSIVVEYNSIHASSNPFVVSHNTFDHFEFAPITTQAVNVLFNVTLMAKDAYGNTVTSYSGDVVLDDSTHTITPTSVSVVDGVWSGKVKIATAADGVKITATDSDGKTGESNAFNVRVGEVGDMDNDGKVDIVDFSILMTNWGSTEPGCVADLNGDGIVDIVDFSILMSHWTN